MLTDAEISQKISPKCWGFENQFCPGWHDKETAHKDLADDKQAPDYIHTCSATAPEMSTAGFQVENKKYQACYLEVSVQMSDRW